MVHGNLRSSPAPYCHYQALNDRLAFTERRFLSKAGLPHRKWFKHVLQSPGLYLGYEAESFPGITQAINSEEWVLAQEQVVVSAVRVEAAAHYLMGTSSES